MEYLYREGTTHDKDQLRELGLISYGQFKGAFTEDNWGKLHSFLSAEDSYSAILKISKSYVCENKGKIIGMAFLVPKGNPTEIFQEDWSYIRIVGVHPNFAGKGIGKRLTKMCIDFARATCESVVALHTAEFMDAARHIYERFGFKQIKELTPRYGKRYWLYQLEL